MRHASDMRPLRYTRFALEASWLCYGCTTTNNKGFTANLKLEIRQIGRGPGELEGDSGWLLANSWLSETFSARRAPRKLVVVACCTRTRQHSRTPTANIHDQARETSDVEAERVQCNGCGVLESSQRNMGVCVMTQAVICALKVRSGGILPEKNGLWHQLLHEATSPTYHVATVACLNCHTEL